MLQSLLAERFKLVIHQDTRPMSGYVLTLGKDKHKLKEATGPGSGCQGNPPPQPPPPVPMLNGSCKGVTMEQFAQTLRQIANGYITTPVQDQTGLKGYWDFDVSVHAVPGPVPRGFGRHHGVRDGRTATGVEARSRPRADAGLRGRDRERRADAQSVGRVRGHSVAAADGVRRRRDQAESAGHAATHAADAWRPHRGRRHHDASDHAARVGHHH